MKSTVNITNENYAFGKSTVTSRKKVNNKNVKKSKLKKKTTKYLGNGTGLVSSRCTAVSADKEG